MADRIPVKSDEQVGESTDSRNLLAGLLDDQTNGRGNVVPDGQLEMWLRFVGRRVDVVIGLAASKIEVQLDPVSRGDQVIGEGFDIGPAEKNGSSAGHGVEVGSDVELGRMHPDATRGQAIHRAKDETLAKVNRSNMLEGARRPDEVKVGQVGRNGIHVDDPVRHEASELLRGAESTRIQACQTIGMLARVDPAGLLSRGPIEVGGHNRAAEAGEQGGQGFLTNTKSQAPATLPQHAALR